ncbi:hypothetical protein HOO65_110054 [Ceratocystis lukuohia]|uniref:Uncharacterized protein n=1 Tax=Ceratocystis lukuohia TaxID=2019550 RepID=A0ABR4M8L2_9PEZI
MATQSIAERFPKLRKQLDELGGYPDGVNLDNFKVHLSLKSSFNVWFHGNAISDDTVNNVMIPEVKQIIHEAQKQVKKRRPNAFLEMEDEIERAFKIPEKAHPAYGYPSQNLCDDLTEYHQAFKQSAWEYLSPYTSIVAPSGTGKSYTVSQLAVKHNKAARASGISPEYFFRYQTEKHYAPVQEKTDSALNFVIEATKPSCPRCEHSRTLPDFAPFSGHFQSVFRDDTNDSDDENSDEGSNEDNIQDTSKLRNEYASEDNCKANAEDGSQRQVSDRDSQSDLEFVICIDEARNPLFDGIDRFALPFPP